MKAIRVSQTGGPDVLSYEDVEVPALSPSGVLVKIEAAGINYIDTYQRSGLYPVKLPMTLGLEGAGTVEKTGDKAEGFAAGDRVAFTGIPGAYAEYASVPAARLVHLPEGVDVKQGAALMLQGTTAHYLAKSTYPLKDGETCLVHAAAGGVGLLLTQIAKMAGARVIATVSTEEKAELARGAGADEVLLYTEVDFEQEVRRLTDGKGVQVVYDSVGKTTFDKSLGCLAPRGCLALFGQSSGPVPPFDPGILNQKGSLFLTRPSLVHYIADRASLEARTGDLFNWVKQKKLSLRIEHVFPLAEAAEAHRSLEGRKTTGKVLLIP